MRHRFLPALCRNSGGSMVPLSKLACSSDRGTENRSNYKTTRPRSSTVALRPGYSSGQRRGRGSGPRPSALPRDSHSTGPALTIRN